MEINRSFKDVDSFSLIYKEAFPGQDGFTISKMIQIQENNDGFSYALLFSYIIKYRKKRGLFIRKNKLWKH